MDVSLMQLAVPILAAAVLVWIGSSIMHMVLPHHRSDYGKVPDEDGVQALLRAGGARPGMYNFPHMASQDAMKDPAFKKKCDDGPVGVILIGPNGLPNMGKLLGLHFAYCVLVSLLAGYVALITIPAGADYLLVFRVTAVVAWIGYSAAHISASIWWFQSWSVTFKFIADGFVYGLLTGGAFGWLWPA